MGSLGVRRKLKEDLKREEKQIESLVGSLFPSFANLRRYARNDVLSVNQGEDVDVGQQHE